MKAGDMIRFRSESKTFFSRSEVWNIGLLVEYHTWEKVASILYKGKVIRVHASDVQKAGKKDIENYLESTPRDIR